MNCLGRLPIWDVKTPRNAVFYIEIFAKGLQNSRNAQIQVVVTYFPKAFYDFLNEME